MACHVDLRHCGDYSAPGRGAGLAIGGRAL